MGPFSEKKRVALSKNTQILQGSNLFQDGVKLETKSHKILVTLGGDFRIMTKTCFWDILQNRHSHMCTYLHIWAPPSPAALSATQPVILALKEQINLHTTRKSLSSPGPFQGNNNHLPSWIFSFAKVFWGMITLTWVPGCKLWSYCRIGRLWGRLFRLGHFGIRFGKF